MSTETFSTESYRQRAALSALDGGGESFAFQASYSDPHKPGNCWWTANENGTGFCRLGSGMDSAPFPIAASDAYGRLRAKRLFRQKRYAAYLRDFEELQGALLGTTGRNPRWDRERYGRRPSETSNDRLDDLRHLAARVRAERERLDAAEAELRSHPAFVEDEDPQERQRRAEALARELEQLRQYAIQRITV